MRSFNRGVAKAQGQQPIDLKIYSEFDAIDIERKQKMYYRIRFKKKGRIEEQESLYWTFDSEKNRDEWILKLQRRKNANKKNR